MTIHRHPAFIAALHVAAEPETYATPAIERAIRVIRVAMCGTSEPGLALVALCRMHDEIDKRADRTRAQS